MVPLHVALLLSLLSFLAPLSHSQEFLQIGSVQYVPVSLPFSNVTSFTYMIQVPANYPVFVTVTDADQACPHIWAITASNLGNNSETWTNFGPDPYPLSYNLARSTVLRTLPIPKLAATTNITVVITPQSNTCTYAPKGPTDVVGFYVDVETPNLTPLTAQTGYVLRFGQRLFFELPYTDGAAITTLRLDSCGETAPHNSSYTLLPKWGYAKFFPTQFNYSSTLAVDYDNSYLSTLEDFAIIGNGDSIISLSRNSESKRFYFYVEFTSYSPTPSVRFPPFNRFVLANLTDPQYVWFGYVVDETAVQLAPVVNGDDLIIYTTANPYYAQRSVIPSDYRIFASCSAEAFNYVHNGSFSMTRLFGSYCYFLNPYSNATRDLFSYSVNDDQKQVWGSVFSFTLEKYFAKCPLPKGETASALITILDTKNEVAFGGVVQVNPSSTYAIPALQPTNPDWTDVPAILFYVSLGALVIAIIIIIVQCVRGGKKNGYTEIRS